MEVPATVLAVILVLLVFVTVGGLWSIYRELYIRELHREYSKMAADAISACKDVQHSMQRVVEKIEERTDMAREHRNDIISEIRNLDKTVGDVERRVETTMRAIQQGGSNVHVITGGTNQNTFGDNSGSQSQK
jgi:uncharacterized NAD-dependent epimerase/dehydratase family protein